MQITKNILILKPVCNNLAQFYDFRYLSWNFFSDVLKFSWKFVRFVGRYLLKLFTLFGKKHRAGEDNQIIYNSKSCRATELSKFFASQHFASQVHPNVSCKLRHYLHRSKLIQISGDTHWSLSSWLYHVPHLGGQIKLSTKDSRSCVPFLFLNRITGKDGRVQKFLFWNEESIVWIRSWEWSKENAIGDWRRVQLRSEVLTIVDDYSWQK